MEVVNRIFGKYGNKLFINTELVLLFRLHGNSRPDGCCSHATHIWPNCRRGDGSTCDWGWEWTVSSTAHEAYQWYNFCKSYENITKFTKYMMKLGSIVTILFYWFGQAYAFCPVAPHVLGADFKRLRNPYTPALTQWCPLRPLKCKKSELPWGFPFFFLWNILDFRFPKKQRFLGGVTIFRGCNDFCFLFASLRAQSWCRTPNFVRPP